MPETLTVQSFQGFAALEHHAEQIDALNRASARSNPYLSAAFLRCICEHNEYFPNPDEVRLYTVWEQGQLIGCLPLRQVADRFGPLRANRLCWLSPVDLELPGIICAAADEQRVARAFLQHLHDAEPQLGMLELSGLRPGSVLDQALHQAANARFRVRDFEEASYSEVAITWPDLATYYRSLSPKLRSSITRYARLLLAAGTPEIVLTEGVASTSAWFDAYLDLESRSWKHNTPATIVHDERRLQRYRQLVAGQAGFTPSFVGILIDGVLVAGALNGSSADAPARSQGMWGLGMAYDASYADLSPGQLLILLSVHRSIERQEKFLNMLNGFAYYKSRWNAEVIDVRRVQLIRRWSLHNLRGTVGDLIRYLRPRPGWIFGTAGSRQEQEHKDSSPRSDVRPDRSQARAISAQAWAYTGAGLQRLDLAQIKQLLPFDTRPTRQDKS